MSAENVMYKFDWYDFEERVMEAKISGVYYEMSPPRIGEVKTRSTHDVLCDFLVRRPLTQDEIDAVLALVQCRLGALP